LKIKTIAAGLALAIAALCRTIVAQSPPQANPMPLDRKIELMIRSQYSLPGNCDIKIGPRTPSSIPGYDKLTVTLSQGKQSNAVDFLISADSKTLAHFDKFDLDANPALSIDVAGRPIRGNPAAPVTVINFDDLECPVCAYMNQQLFPAALSRYGNQVRFIYKDNPIVAIHPWALHAAVDATCLAGQNATAYWSYVDEVHAHGQEISGEKRDLGKSFAVLDRMAGDEAQKTTLDQDALQACLKKQDEIPVRESMKEAQRLGVDFTPALFVNGEEVRGFTTLHDLWGVIDRALGESDANPPPADVPQTEKQTLVRAEAR
jgi:protein-disulfide isomerase